MCLTPSQLANRSTDKGNLTHSPAQHCTVAYSWDEGQPLPVVAEMGTSSSAGLATGTLDVDHRACTMESLLNVSSFIGESPVRGQWGWSGGLIQVDCRHQKTHVTVTSDRMTLRWS